MLKIACASFLLFLLLGCTQQPNFTKITFEGSSLQLSAQIANTSASRQRGLMFQNSLAQNGAMLFEYQEEQPLHFWMANTKIPLDIIFLGKNKKIIGIQQMQPCEKEDTSLCQIYNSKAPAKYAIELNQNLSQKYGLKIGQAAEWN
ncbi:MAG: DUF192 domain-containing protein [Candidatus Micrarchaeota archaeon]